MANALEKVDLGLKTLNKKNRGVMFAQATLNLIWNRIYYCIRINVKLILTMSGFNNQERRRFVEVLK